MKTLKKIRAKISFSGGDFIESKFDEVFIAKGYLLVVNNEERNLWPFKYRDKTVSKNRKMAIKIEVK